MLPLTAALSLKNMIKRLNHYLICPNCKSPQSWWLAFLGLAGSIGSDWRCYSCGKKLFFSIFAKLLFWACFFTIFWGVGGFLYDYSESINFWSHLNNFWLVIVILALGSLLFPITIFTTFLLFCPSIYNLEEGGNYERNKSKSNLLASNRIFSIKYGLSESMILMWLFSFLLLCSVSVPVLLLTKI